MHSEEEEERKWLAIAGSGAAGNFGAMKKRTDEVERQQLRLDRGLGVGQGV